MMTCNQTIADCNQTLSLGNLTMGLGNQTMMVMSALNVNASNITSHEILEEFEAEIESSEVCRRETSLLFTLLMLGTRKCLFQ